MTKAPVWLSPDSCRLEDFVETLAGEATAEEYPLASEIVANAPIYDGAAVSAAAASEAARREIMAEWAGALLDGPGLYVIRNAVDARAVDAASDVFFVLIDEQRRCAKAAGDHFGKPGANDGCEPKLRIYAARFRERFGRLRFAGVAALAASAVQ